MKMRNGKDGGEGKSVFSVKTLSSIKKKITVQAK